MYGRMPDDLSTHLEAIRDVDQLDAIHDSLVNDAGVDQVRALMVSKREAVPAPAAAAPAADAPAAEAAAAPDAS
jgi:hypothetical protein